MPKITSTNVVFPAPENPTIATNLNAAISKSIEFKLNFKFPGCEMLRFLSSTNGVKPVCINFGKGFVSSIVVLSRSSSIKSKVGPPTLTPSFIWFTLC